MSCNTVELLLAMSTLPLSSSFSVNTRSFGQNGQDFPWTSKRKKEDGSAWANITILLNFYSFFFSSPLFSLLLCPRGTVGRRGIEGGGRGRRANLEVPPPFSLLCLHPFSSVKLPLSSSYPFSTHGSSASVPTVLPLQCTWYPPRGKAERSVVVLCERRH